LVFQQPHRVDAASVYNNALVYSFDARSPQTEPFAATEPDLKRNMMFYFGRDET